MGYTPISLPYEKLDRIRHGLASASQAQIKDWLHEIRELESETIQLLVEEKLSANDSYLVFMQLVELIRRELNLKLTDLDEQQV